MPRVVQFYLKQVFDVELPDGATEEQFRARLPAVYHDAEKVEFEKAITATPGARLVSRHTHEPDGSRRHELIP